MSEPTNSYFMTRPQLVCYTKRLEEEVEKLTQEAKYWRIEATTDHDRWLRVLEENERLRKAGAILSKETMVIMLNGGAHEELIKAHDNWKDLVDGKPDWGKTCKKPV